MTSLTRLLILSFALTLSLFLAACGGGGGGLTIGIGSAPDYYVDAVSGDDLNDGTAASPFKTITHALDEAGYGSTVYVAPGMYDVSHGETFPLLVPFGVRLLGDQPNKGKGPTPTVIRGGGLVPGGVVPDTTATLVPALDTAIGGFIIHNSNPVSNWRRVGVLIDAPGVRVRNSTIQNNPDVGVLMLSGAGMGHVHRNVIRDNGFGMYFSTGGTSMRIDRNAIVDNQYGVVVTGQGADLGGGSAGSDGKNRIAFNSVADLLIKGSGHVDAKDNYWNHVPPTMYIGINSSGMPPGVDIWRVFPTSSVATAGAQLAVTISWIPPSLPIGP